MPDWKSYKDVKICVYAIAADEPEEFIDRWLESMKGADYITVLITKKENPNTAYFVAQSLKPDFKDKLIVKEQEIKPWRFDVARNESMKLIPEDTDACICTDIDEVLIKDFWDDYRKCVFEHPDFNRIYYRYAWSSDDQGNPKTVFWYDKTHKRDTYHWDYPVHETLTKNSDAQCIGEYYLDENKIYLKHLPDQTKSRGSYLNLLELRAREYSQDLYGLYYLAREYTFVSDWKKAISTAMYLYLQLGSNDDYLMKPCVCNLLGVCYSKWGYSDEAEYYLNKAIKLDPTLRDAYINLAQKYAYENKPNQCIQLIDEMSQKTQYREDWRLNPICWRNWKVYQILGDAYMWLNQYMRAREYFIMALEDITTDDAVREAQENNFYVDLEFLNSKLKELESSDN